MVPSTINRAGVDRGPNPARPGDGERMRELYQLDALLSAQGLWHWRGEAG